MTPEEFQRLSALFEEARGLAPAERAAFLDGRCGADGELRRRVEDLLVEHHSAGPGLGIPAPAAPRPAEDPDLRAGEVIGGKYKVLEPIGEGGLGVVHLAEQLHPVRRRVALKVVKLGMDTRQVLARFEAERNTLTLLDHPGIARLHDAGVTERGRPYFVMEHIPGLSIIEFADREGLDTRQRLRLFIQVCAAVQHAHQKGIIHRDLKPSNILVGLQDGRPAPKVIDFGIAKAIARPLTELTVHTEQGQLIGTPEYMSPEQAEMTGLGIDSTSDIYSLGVILYQLLTGVLPFESRTLRGKGIPEIQRIIREEDPPRPSTRVSTLGDTTQVLVRQRRTEPRLLVRELRGDLDWITMKAMEKIRSRRYPSASELAADVARYLAHQPVLAGPPGAGYKLRKFVRRNRALVGAGVLVCLALLAGVAGTTWGMLESNAQRDRAVVALEDTKTARDQARSAQALAVEALERAEINVYYSRVAQAELSFRVQDLARSEASLEECAPAPGRPDPRGWEWRYLRGLTRAGAALPEVHRTVVYGLVFSGDGGLLASGGGVPNFFQLTGAEPGELKVWDADSGRLLHRSSTALSVTGLGMDAARGRLAVATSHIKTGAGASIRLIQAATGSPAGQLSLPEALLYPGPIVFDRQGLRFAASARGVLTIWDAAALRPLRTLVDQSHPLFSEDGARLTTYGIDGSLTEWDVATGEPIRRVEGLPPRPELVAFSPDGSLVATVGLEMDSVAVIDAASGRLRRTLRTHPEDTHALAFSPDGRLLATAGSGAAVRLWNVAGGKEELQLLGHTNRLLRLCFTEGGDRLASAGWDGTVRVWDLTRHPERLVLSPPADGDDLRAEALAFLPDGRLLTAHSGSTLRTWDGRTGIPLELRGIHDPPAFAVPSRRWVFGKGGRILYRVGPDGLEIRSEEVESGLAGPVFRGQAHPVFQVACAGEGGRIAAAGWSRRKPGEPRAAELRVWDAVDGRSVFSRQLSGELVLAIALDPAGRRLAQGGAVEKPEGGEIPTLRLWDLEAERSVDSPAPAMERIEAIAFSRDGLRWAAADGAGRVVLHDAEPAAAGASPSAPKALRGPAGLADLAFSPDGRRLAGANRELVTLWDTATGHEVIRLRGPPRSGWDPMFNPRVVFSEDGERIAAGQWDQTTFIWSAEERWWPGAGIRPAPASVSAWRLRQARDALKEGNRPAAEAHLRRGAAVEPPSRSLRIDRGILHARLGLHEEAIRDLAAALDGRPDRRLLESRGASFAALGRFQEAGEDFTMAAALEPHDAGASWIGLAYLALARGDGEGFRRAARELPERLARAPFAEALLGNAARALAGPEPGLPDELRALAAGNPGFPLASLVLAIALLREGDREGALSFLGERTLSALKEEALLAAGHSIAALAQAGLGRESEARALLERARSSSPGGPSAGPSVPPGVDWRHWTLLRALLAEAEAALPEKK